MKLTILFLCVLVGLGSSQPLQTSWPHPHNPSISAIGYDLLLTAFVDCTSGSDSSGDGSFINPYATISFAQTTFSSGVTTPTIYIKNGPCGEGGSAWTPLPQYNYVGTGSTIPVITNGLYFVATSSDFGNALLSWLSIPSVTWDSTASSNIIELNFFSVVIGGGSMKFYNPVNAVITAVFYNSAVSLTTLSGAMRFAKCSLSVSNVLQYSSILLEGGKWTGSSSIGLNTYLAAYKSDLSSASLSSTGGGQYTTPLLSIGQTHVGSNPSISGILLNSVGDLPLDQDVIGTATIATGQVSITVTFAAAMADANYFVGLTHRNSVCFSSTRPFYLSAKTATTFTVQGQQGCQFDWKVQRE